MAIKLHKSTETCDLLSNFLKEHDVEFVDVMDESNISLEPYSTLSEKRPYAHLNEKILNYPFGEKIVETFLEQEFGRHPETFFRGIIIKNSSLKVLDRASYGLYCDYICSEANDLNFSTRPLRRFLTDFFMIADRFSYTNEVFLPLAVDYGKGKKTFYCQFSCKLSNEFRYDFFLKNLVEVLKNTNAMEVSISPDGNTLLVRAYWFRDFDKSDWPSLFLSESIISQQEESFEDADLVTTTHSPQVKEKLISLSDIPHEDSIEKKQWRFMRKVLLSFVNLKEEYHANEKDFPHQFSIDVLNQFISETNEEEAYSKLKESEKEILISCLNEMNPHDEFQQIFYNEMIDIDPKELMENIQEKIEKTDLSKVVDEPENTLVKGNREEVDEVQVIKGTPQKIDNSIWKIKQQKVVNDLKGEYSKLDNPLPQQVEEVLSEALRKELAGNDAKLDEFVTDVVDAISEELLPESIPNSKFVNRSINNLKGKVTGTLDRSIEVPTLELKLMLSFTDKLIRKGKNYENSLKKESEKNAHLKNQVMNVTSAKNNEDLSNAIEKNKELKARVLQLERELEINKANDKPSKSREGGLQEDMQKIVDGLNEDVKSAKADALDYKRQLKINENEMAKLKTQLARHMKNTGQGGAGSSNENDSPSNTRVKQLEKLNLQYQETAQKMEKEVSIKKTELHGARLEAKTLAHKVKALEKKLEILSRKRAS